jgi:two-component system, response regulator, stage 0 sporulation protein F
MRKLLLVDDDEAIRMLYSEELSEEGYDVVSIGGASGLLQLIERESPDLIVLDINLDKCSGLDLLQDIRNIHYDLPVVLCTAYGMFKDDLKSISADYYVVKSSNLNELKEKIRMALESDQDFRESSSTGCLYR